LQFRSCSASVTARRLAPTGTVNPGLIYVGDKYQLAAETIM